MENQKIGAFICEARKAKGLTQKQLRGPGSDRQGRQ